MVVKNYDRNHIGMRSVLGGLGRKCRNAVVPENRARRRRIIAKEENQIRLQIALAA